MKQRKSRLNNLLNRYKDADSANLSRFFGDETEPDESSTPPNVLDVDELYDNRSIPNQNQAAGNLGTQQNDNEADTTIPNYASDVTPVLPDNEHNDATTFNIGNDVFPAQHHMVESTDIAVNPDHFLPLTSQTVINSPNAALNSGSDVANPAFMYVPSSEKGGMIQDALSLIAGGDDTANEIFNAATTINATNPHSHIPSLVGANIEHLIDTPRPPPTNLELRIDPELGRIEQSNFTNPLNEERRDEARQDRSGKTIPDSSLPSTPESLYEAALYGNAALQALKLYKGLTPDDVGIAKDMDETEVVDFVANPDPTPNTTPISQQNRTPRQSFVNVAANDPIPPHNETINEESALIASSPLTAGGDTIDYRVEENPANIIGREVVAPASHYEDDPYSAPPDQNIKGMRTKSIATSFIDSPYRDFGTNPNPVMTSAAKKSYDDETNKITSYQTRRLMYNIVDNVKRSIKGMNSDMYKGNSRIKNGSGYSYDDDDDNGDNAAYSADSSINEALAANMSEETQNNYYSDPSTPAGANTNVHAEPISEFIAAFNLIAVDSMRDMTTAGIPKILDPRFEDKLVDRGINYAVITPERLENVIACGEQALEEHKASLAIAKPDSMDEDQYALFIDSNSDIVDAIDKTLNYLLDALELVDASRDYDSSMLPVVGDIDDDPTMDGDVATIMTLNAHYYESLYYASLFLQRSGDRFDQFVVNMVRPADRFDLDAGVYPTETDGDNNDNVEFDNDWNYVAGTHDTTTDAVSSDVTSQLLNMADVALSYGKTDRHKTRRTKDLSLRQTLTAYNTVYSRVMSAAGGWLYANPLVSGVSKAELDELAKEGLIRYDSSSSTPRFTLTRQGYERPQWLDLSSPVKPVAGGMPRY